MSKGEMLTRESAQFENLPADEESLAAILRLLRDQYGIDFSFYKLNTVVRRTERRLQLNRIDAVKDYLRRLETDPAELSALYQDLLVGVTRFFRDQEAFDRLGEEIDQSLKNLEPGTEFRAWVAGCATGEEAYSIAILLDERIRASGKEITSRIFATDVHPVSLDQAGTATYRQESIGNISPDRLVAYFTRNERGYTVNQRIRHMVVFASHNILKDAPFTRMELVICRNLLIYLQPGAQKRALSRFHFGLKFNGILFLGPSESLGELENEFEPVDRQMNLYRKRRDICLNLEMQPTLAISRGSLKASGLPEYLTPAVRGIDLYVAGAYDALLAEFMPPGLLIDGSNRLLHVFGDAGKYLRHPNGRPSHDVLDCLDAPFILAVGGAIRHTQLTQEPAHLHGVQVGRDILDLVILPVRNSRIEAVDYLITFSPVNIPALPDTPSGETIDMPLTPVLEQEIQALAAELRRAKEYTQVLIEELETRNEELQATNEELLASNEERQSTNEELHSANEELHTVNAEHQRKIVQLTVLTDDMENLLHSTQVHTLFLDRQLRIRQFTPWMGEIFNLVQHDIGRSIQAFHNRLQCRDLMEVLRLVLETGQLRETEIQDGVGRWFQMRILPYVTDKGREGVVLTLTDVTELKVVVAAKESQVEQRDLFMATLSHELRNPLGAVTSGLRLLQLSGDNTEQQRKTLAAIDRQTSQMTSLLDDLLDVARVTKGKIELRRAPTRLDDIVRESVESVMPLFEKRNQSVRISLEDQSAWADGDAVRLRQIVNNLLTNACRYSPIGETISISLERISPSLGAIRVKDQGIGIPREMQERVFEPFAQLRRTHNEASEGLGLGLSLSRCLAELHGGTVTVFSEGEARGSEFTVQIPLIEPPTMDCCSTPMQPGTERETQRSIVLVEDNEDARDMLRQLLQYEFFEVATAADGLTGLDLIRQLRPQVALIDIGLPGMNGHEIAKALRSDGLTTFLIALTGYGQDSDRKAALNAGFNEHITKPLDFDNLLRLLERVIAAELDPK